MKVVALNHAKQPVSFNIAIIIYQVILPHGGVVAFSLTKTLISCPEFIWQCYHMCLA